MVEFSFCYVGWIIKPPDSIWTNTTADYGLVPSSETMRFVIAEEVCLEEERLGHPSSSTSLSSEDTRLWSPKTNLRLEDERLVRRWWVRLAFFGALEVPRMHATDNRSNI